MKPYPLSNTMKVHEDYRKIRNLNEKGKELSKPFRLPDTLE